MLCKTEKGDKRVNYDELSKIQTSIYLAAGRKTQNLLDGDYTSVYKGRSMEFDDLREYVVGDNIRDIDWKSSSRTGRILVRRNIAQKKHNVLFILDSGKKMRADTSTGDAKSDVAVTALGVLGFIVNRHGDDFTCLMGTEESISYNFFRTGKNHLQNMLSEAEKEIVKDSRNSLNQLLSFTNNHIRRNKIIVIITDIDGLSTLDEDILKELTAVNDILLVNVDDAYLFGDDVFDVDSGRYEPDMVARQKRLRDAEKDARIKLIEKTEEILRRYKITFVTVRSDEEAVDKIMELLEKHRYEIIR